MDGMQIWFEVRRNIESKSVDLGCVETSDQKVKGGHIGNGQGRRDEVKKFQMRKPSHFSIVDIAPAHKLDDPLA